MIKSDYHVHTTFVDGKSDAEKIVQKAIELGMSEIGFSEHAHVAFDTECSLSSENTKVYRKTIKQLKEKYADKISILCGIEMDRFSDDDPSEYEYVIGSVHYLKVHDEYYAIDLSPEETLRCINCGFSGNIKNFVKAYYDTVSELKDVTEANIIGHFDIITKFENRGIVLADSEEFYSSCSKKAMLYLYKSSAFEINTGGMIRGYKFHPYPCADILKNLAELGGRAVINSDSHSKDSLMKYFGNAENYASECGFLSLSFTDRQGRLHRQK